MHPRRNLVFVADSKTTACAPSISTLAKSTPFGSPSAGDCDGQVSIKFSTPVALAWDNDCNLIVTDIGNHSIKRVNVLDASVSTVAGRSGVAGYVDGPRTGPCSTPRSRDRWPGHHCRGGRKKTIFCA